MKTEVCSIPLSNSSTSDGIVKSSALLLFRGLRTLADYAAQIPDVATQAASDIAEAWEESSRPNVR